MHEVSQKLKCHELKRHDFLLQNDDYRLRSEPEILFRTMFARSGIRRAGVWPSMWFFYAPESGCHRVKSGGPNSGNQPVESIVPDGGKLGKCEGSNPKHGYLHRYQRLSGVSLSRPRKNRASLGVN
ncbi:AGC/AKT protein kinase [Anopheles sinensis]|uniref:AGC/AKT protein kinase n=1 Tax=Anopheles sinensis TaxID=74873 RepID=A0A084WCE4_ANOSI|nr:AGC/AKT protein kinase [Anopheles sinensis]